MILTSCAGTYDIKGTSNVSVLDGKMLYLKQYHDSDLKNIDSCDVVHGQFGFNGRLDSVRMVTLFMDDENIMPVVLESGSINVKIDNGSQKVSGTPLNDKLSEFIEKYNQLEMQMNDLAHKQSQAIMNGEDENTINQKLAIEAQQITQKEDKLITSFICDNFDNVLGPGVFFMMTMGYPIPELSPWIEDIMSKATDTFKNNKYVKEYMTAAERNQNIGNGMETPPVTPQQPLQTTTNVAPPTPAEMAKPAQ